MRVLVALWTVFSSSVLAQSGQDQTKPGWPCVAGRAVDPAYIELAERSGGQLFLFQKGEVSTAGILMSGTMTHPQTITRAVGTVAGLREFEFAVDPSVASLLIGVSVQCRQSVAVIEPRGSEVVAANALHAVDLKAGKIVEVGRPQAGTWRVRIAGQGLFTFFALAQTGISFSPAELPVSFKPGAALSVNFHADQRLTSVRVFLVGPAGEPLGETKILQGAESGDGTIQLIAPATDFRIQMRAIGEPGLPVLRTHPNLYRAGSDVF